MKAAALYFTFTYVYLCWVGMSGGYAVAQSNETLRYKPEGRGFTSRGSSDFSLTLSFRSHYGPGVDSAFNRNNYQMCSLGGKNGRCVGLTTLPPSCADCLNVLGHSNSWSLRGLSRPVQGEFHLLPFSSGWCYIGVYMSVNMYVCIHVYVVYVCIWTHFRVR